MAESVPVYKNPKFLITAGVVLVATGLVAWAVISDAQWVHVVEFVVSAYLGGSGG